MSEPSPPLQDPSSDRLRMLCWVARVGEGVATDELLRLRKLVVDLYDYAGHLPWCNFGRGYGDAGDTCDCGWTEFKRGIQ